MRRHLLVIAVLLLAAAPAHAKGMGSSFSPWPPVTGPGHLFAHYGEEHLDDADGRVVLPAVVAAVARYRPDLVTMSGDKGSDGTKEQLTAWRDLMAAFDRAGIPYMAGVGNHDGKQQTPEPVTDQAAGSTPTRDVTFYKEVFAVRPYPMGDAAPYRDPLMGPSARPPGDPAGASTHFFADYGNVRFVFMDNSCYGIVNCDPLQNPPDDTGRSQYQFLRDSAAEAKAQGRLVFVVMHMPTRDPRDQSESYLTSRNHVMGKGASPDNQTFEQEAEALKVDGVLVGHIKGQFQYVGRGGIPYYIDGGAGGELYTTGPLGVDHGYWYGFRLLRVDGRSVTTDVVPVIAPGGIAVQGPTVLERPSGIVRYQAFARQPATASERAVVKALELRDPDPVPVSGSGGVPGWIVWLAPLLLVPVLALTAGLQERAPRRRLARTAAVAGLGLLATAGLAGAQRSDPTSTPKEALPNPARIFTTGDPRILAPSASATDDPRRDTRTQTADGAFVPGCPGHTRVTVTSGWEQGFTAVRVKSNPGRILRRFDRRASVLTRGRTARVAAVRLEQAAIVEAVVRRGGRTVARLGGACLGRGAHAVRWRPGRGLKAGAYRLEVRVRSDRPTVVRRAPLRVD